MLNHPGRAARPCSLCKEWMINEDESFPRDGVGNPIPRPKGVSTPCHSCPKIPGDADKTPVNAVEVTELTLRAYRHYRQCRAVGIFPHDPTVRENARIIRDIEDRQEMIPLNLIAAQIGNAILKG